MDDRDNITVLNQSGAQAPEKEEPQEGGPLTLADLERIVEQAVARQLARLQMAANSRAAQPRAEAERPADMGRDGAIQAREDELDRRERELNRRELRAWAAEELARRGLPGELIDAVDCDDAERCAACVDMLDRTFRATVQRSVDERIGRGHSLPRSSGSASADFTQRMRLAAGLADA